MIYIPLHRQQELEEERRGREEERRGREEERRGREAAERHCKQLEAELQAVRQAQHP
jgi:hypothetical protein